MNKHPGCTASARLAASSDQGMSASRSAAAELHERMRIARRARSLGELLRDQWDLLPMTHARLQDVLRRHRAQVQALLDAR